MNKIASDCVDDILYGAKPLNMNNLQSFWEEYTSKPCSEPKVFLCRKTTRKDYVEAIDRGEGGCKVIWIGNLNEQS